MIAVNFKQMIKKFFGSMGLNLILKIKPVLVLFLIYPFFEENQIGVYAVGLTISGLLSPIFLLNIMDGSNKFFLKNPTYANQLGAAIKSYTSGILILLLVLFYFIYFYSNLDPLLIKVSFYLIIFRLLFKIIIYRFEIYQELIKTFILNILVEFGSLIFVFIYLSNNIDPNIEVIPISLLLITFLISIVRCKAVYNFNFFYLIKSWTKFKEPIKVSLKLLPAPYLIILIQSTDVLLLSWLIGFDANGIYHIANSIALLVSMLSASLSYFWYSSATLSKPKLIQNILEKSIYLYLVFIIPLFLFFFYLSKYIFILLFSFDAHLVTSFLAMGYFTLFFTQMFHGFFYSSSYYHLIVKVSFFTFCLNVIFSFFLIKQYEINGAGFATFLSYVLGYCYCIYVYKKIKK